MKKLIMLLLMAVVSAGYVDAKPKKSKSFEIRLPTEFSLRDNTDAYKIKNPTVDSKLESILRISFTETVKNAYFKAYTISEDDVVIDTLVMEFYIYKYGKWAKTKIKPEISFSAAKDEYFANFKEYQLAFAKYNALVDKYTKDFNSALRKKIEFEEKNKREAAEAQRQRAMYDSLKQVEAEERRIRDEKYAIEMERIHKWGETDNYVKLLNFDIDAKPAGQILTKSFDNIFGATITYSYYMDENDLEVKHGTQTKVSNFKNFGVSDYGIYGYTFLNGNETVTETYKHGYQHGKITYKANVTGHTSRNNNFTINESFTVNLWKGYLDGNINLTYNDIKYQIVASKGIAKSIVVQKPNSTTSIKNDIPFVNDESVKVTEVQRTKKGQYIKNIEIGILSSTFLKIPLICEYSE